MSLIDDYAAACNAIDTVNRMLEHLARSGWSSSGEQYQDVKSLMDDVKVVLNGLKKERDDILKRIEQG